MRVEPATRPVKQTPADAPADADKRTDKVPRVADQAEPKTARVVSPARTDRAAPVRSSPVTRPRTFGRALLATAAATLVPGVGHLMLRRRRSGTLIVGVFVLLVLSAVLLVTTASRATLLANLLSTRVLVLLAVGALVAGAAWIAVIVRTYLLARPRPLGFGKQLVGVVVTAALCLVIAAPFGYAANLANAQRTFIEDLFGGDTGGTAAAEAIGKPRLNVLLVGSDAGPDREGTRTDTMMVASIDTRSGRTILFGLPRNLGHVPFPPESPMGKKFPDGFHNRADPLSGDYLLNAVYAWGRDHPQDAPATPTTDPGLNLLHQTISYMLGLELDYYVEVNMAGFAALIDALGGLWVDTGPNPVPVGGILPDGRRVKPDRYIPAGRQLLNGEDALAFARSRTDSTDYARMGRQRCLLQNLLTQKSPTDILVNFQAVANATTDSVSTNIPQAVLPSLAALAGEDTVRLESIAFDPSLPDPSRPDGKFSTARVNTEYMREVVQRAINGQPLPTVEPTATPRASASASVTPTPPPTGPQSLAEVCG